MSMFSLQDKVAVITGGGSGIGLSTAKRFSEAGAKVIIACRTDSTELAESFGGTYIKTDVAIEEDVEQLMSKAQELHGLIDVVVNNAGYATVGIKTLDISKQEMEKHININLMGVFYGIKYGAPKMRRGGSIINVASLAGIVGFPTYAPYSTAKTGVLGLTKSAALELGPEGIRVNAVCPGTIETPINELAGAEDEYELVKYVTALQRTGQPEEIASVIHFLAANDSSYITGEAIVADGGWMAGPSLGAMEKIIN